MTSFLLSFGPRKDAVMYLDCDSSVAWALGRHSIHNQMYLIAFLNQVDSCLEDADMGLNAQQENLQDRPWNYLARHQYYSSWRASTIIAVDTFFTAERLLRRSFTGSTAFIVVLQA